MKVIRRRLSWDEAVAFMHEGKKVNVANDPEGYYLCADGLNRFVDNRGHEFWPRHKDHIRTDWQVVE